MHVFMLNFPFNPECDYGLIIPKLTIFVHFSVPCTETTGGDYTSTIFDDLHGVMSTKSWLENFLSVLLTLLKSNLLNHLRLLER